MKISRLGFEVPLIQRSPASLQYLIHPSRQVPCHLNSGPSRPIAPYLPYPTLPYQPSPSPTYPSFPGFFPLAQRKRDKIIGRASTPTSSYRGVCTLFSVPLHLLQIRLLHVATRFYSQLTKVCICEVYTAVACPEDGDFLPAHNQTSKHQQSWSMTTSPACFLPIAQRRPNVLKSL